MLGSVMVDMDQLHRIRAALQDAERWTAKYCADNSDEGQPGLPLQSAKKALSRISAVYTEIGRLPRSGNGYIADKADLS